MMKKTVLFFLSLTLVCSLLAGCQSSGNDNPIPSGPSGGAASPEAPAAGAGGKTTLVLASPGQDVDQAAFDKVIAEFYATNPDIEVEAIAVPNTGWADYIAKIKTMIAGGTPPDVIRIAVQGIAEMVDQGLALPMSGYLAENPDLINLADYYPSEILDYATFDGQLYGLPWDANNVVLHVNSGLVEKAGATVPAAGQWTLDQFLAFSQSISKEIDGQKAYAYAMPHNYFAASAWVLNNGASFFNEDMSACTINDPKAVEVFQLLQDMIYEYGISPQPTPESNYTNQFVSGQVAMITAGRWTHGTYVDNGMQSVVLVPLPKLETNVTTYGFGVYSAMAATQHPQEAMRLAAFMAGEYSQRNYLDGGSIPSMSGVAKDVIPQAEPVPGNYELFLSTAFPVKVVESPKQYSAVEAVFNRYYSMLLANEITAGAMCEGMYEEMAALL